MSNMQQPIQLVSVPEIARRGRLCAMTVSRFIKANAIAPDALLITTGRKPPVMCFVEPRAEQILKRIESTGN